MAELRDLIVTTGFRHAERDRTIVFGPGALDAAQDLLPPEFTLLTTDRAAGSQPAIVRRAAAVVEVPSGAVDALAADLRDRVGGRALVALGGGRVIDTAKAIAAAEGIAVVIAIPTSLSGAEMTGVHRHACGVPDHIARMRATVVINDPALTASLPSAQLAAGTANAAGHALTALLSIRSTPIAQAVGRAAIQRFGQAWAEPQPDKCGLALGALLAGWSVDVSGLGPHHALVQTAVRAVSIGHAHVNAVLLPHTIRAFRDRAAEQLASIDADLGTPLEEFAESLRTRAAATGLGDLVDHADTLKRTSEAAAARPEMQLIPPPIDADEAMSIYRAAAAVLPSEHEQEG